MQDVFTIGHSTRPIDEFIELLFQNGVEQLVDIRSIPRSRHNPQFEEKMLQKSLATVNIDYAHLGKLGGLRPRADHSVNTAWRNVLFRNYADYMQTDDFIKGMDELIKIAKLKPTVLMCAEAVPWRCHRSLVSAYVLALLIGLLPDQSPYLIAGLVWLGFVLPTEASAMIFGGAPDGYVWHKIAISTAESLVHLLAAAWVISLF